MKKLFIPTVFLISLFGLIYPTEKENTNLTDYCFSLEKIVAKNTFDSTNKIDGTTKMIAKGVASFGVENSRGDLTTKIIETFKSESEDSFVKLIPTKYIVLVDIGLKSFNLVHLNQYFMKQLKKWSKKLILISKKILRIMQTT